MKVYIITAATKEEAARKRAELIWNEKINRLRNLPDAFTLDKEGNHVFYAPFIHWENLEEFGNEELIRKAEEQVAVHIIENNDVTEFELKHPVYGEIIYGKLLSKKVKELMYKDESDQ